MNWSLSAKTWSEIEKMSVASDGGCGGEIMGKRERGLVVQTRGETDDRERGEGNEEMKVKSRGPSRFDLA